jgi:hypothetical protein
MLVCPKYKATSLEEYFHIARNRSIAARRSYLKDTRQSCSILSKMRLSKFLRSTYVFKIKNQPGHQQIDSEYLVCIVVFTCHQGLTRSRAPVPRFLMLSSTYPSTDKSMSPYSFPFFCTSLQFLLYDSANPGYHAGPCIYRDKTDITAYRANISFPPKHVVIVFSYIPSTSLPSRTHIPWQDQTAVIQAFTRPYSRCCSIYYSRFRFPD